jgi:tyrosyl-tRNA synthetase
MENNAKLEVANETNTKTINTLQEDSKKFSELNTKLQKDLQEAESYTDDLRKKFDKNFVRNILDGEMTPTKYSKKSFESKYDKIERDEKLAGRGVPNENFVIPTDRLDNVIDKHDGISLKINCSNVLISRCSILLLTKANNCSTALGLQVAANINALTPN